MNKVSCNVCKDHSKYDHSETVFFLSSLHDQAHLFFSETEIMDLPPLFSLSNKFMKILYLYDYYGPPVLIVLWAPCVSLEYYLDPQGGA